MENEDLYFDIQADMGITKHMGGRIATRELAELAHLKEGDSLLEIGCGMGRTACFLAQTYGVKVTSIDISAKMVRKAKTRVKKMGLEKAVTLLVADAQSLPFEEGSFDAIISESVCAFIPDQQKAFKEFERVLKKGGYLAMNEVTWKEQASQGMLDYTSVVMGGANFHDLSTWKTLIEKGGFKEVSAQVRDFKAWEQFIGELQQFNLWEYCAALGRFCTQIMINPKYWRFIRQIFSAPKYLFSFTKKIRQGIYIGKKL